MKRTDLSKTVPTPYSGYDSITNLRDYFKYTIQNEKFVSVLLDKINNDNLKGNEFKYKTIYNKSDEFRKKIEGILKNEIQPSNIESKALAIIYGMVTGDAIGARVEFKPVRYDRHDITGPGEGPGGAFKLQPGQWTDDSSMGLCLGDSFIFNDLKWDPYDCMLRYLGWWFLGYNNAFRKCDYPEHSVGLGGNIAQSFRKFIKNPTRYTTAGDKHTSGNGSLMRLAAIPILFYNDLDKGLYYAGQQSKVTHQGEEAAECCKLATYVMIQGINGKDKKEVLENLGSNFKSTEPSVNVLAQSGIEIDEHGKENKLYGDWRWKEKEYYYSEGRAQENPGYIGSFAMDCLAMSLHCVWSTNSFEEAVLKAVNMRGDADSVGSLTGQIAGSFYGFDHIPKEWIKAVSQWDNNEIGIIGLRLINKIPIKANI